jgi:hypothetical protein
MSIELIEDENSPLQNSGSKSISDYLNHLFAARGVPDAGVYSWRLEVSSGDALVRLLGAEKAAVLEGRLGIELSFSFQSNQTLPKTLGSLSITWIDYKSKKVYAALNGGYETSQILRILGEFA